jgi:hypothetical protein
VREYFGFETATTPATTGAGTATRGGAAGSTNRTGAAKGPSSTNKKTREHKEV